MTRRFRLHPPVGMNANSPASPRLPSPASRFRGEARQLAAEVIHIYYDARRSTSASARSTNTLLGMMMQATDQKIIGSTKTQGGSCALRSPSAA
jgi:hypothetical protein